MSTAIIDDKMVYEQEGVCAVVPESEGLDSNLLPGSLTVTERSPYGTFIEWRLLDTFRPPPSEAESNGWIIADESDDKPIPSPGNSGSIRLHMLKKYEFSIDVKELKSFKCIGPSQSKSIGATEMASAVKFIAKDGSGYTPVRFSTGGYEKLLTVLQCYVSLKRSAREQNLIIVSDMKTEALQRSVNALWEDNADLFQKLISNPIPTAMTGLGKVTSFLSDKVIPALLDFEHLDTDVQRHTAQSLQELQKHEENSKRLQMHRDRDDTGFEVVVSGLDLPERPLVQRDPPVTEELWRSYMTPQGSVQNVGDFKGRVFRGGLCPNLRNEVWRFLLGYYDWNSTESERTELRKRKTDEYYRMKLQWKSVTLEQEERFSEFRDRKALIEKDVARTDRTHKFFEGENNTNVNKLYDILMTYVMYNFDLGYVQGMSDLLSPIMVVMENEVDTFWTFVGFMDKTFKNFELDQQHIKNQLMYLRDVLMYINPALLNYLESHDSDNMYFCFRWLLVLFKREFGFADIMRLWEVLWTDKPCKNFHLLICLAIFESQKEVIMENRFGLTEILKHINDLSMQIDLDKTLSNAEGMYHQLASCQDRLPPHVCTILGFPPPESLTTLPYSYSASSLAAPSCSTTNGASPRAVSPGRSRTAAAEASKNNNLSPPAKAPVKSTLSTGNSPSLGGKANTAHLPPQPAHPGPGIAKRTVVQTLPD